MHYFALLLGPESTEEPDPITQAELMTAYENFHAKAGAAIRAGDALAPPAEGAVIRGGPERPIVTDGPFAEGAEVAGGYYVFEAEDLDEALALAGGIPACQSGGVEVWPMVAWFANGRPLTGESWLALLREPADEVIAPGTPEWEAGLIPHTQFSVAAGDRSNGGGALHPPSTAPTVRVRDGRVTLTDGPFAEGAEVANGIYFIEAADRDEAVKVASMIPSTSVELRQLAGVGGL